MRASDQGIEALRGVAILLVVLFHAERFLPDDGFKTIQLFNDLMVPIRMPLFGAIAGFVYGMRPLERTYLPQFVRGKARRLLLPIISLGLMTWVLKMSPPFFEFPDRFTGAWRVFVYPSGHLWFPEALFFVFMLIALLERRKWLQTALVWNTITALGSLSFFLLQKPLDILHGVPFSIGGAAYLFPFFLVGLGLQRFPEMLATNRTRWIAATVTTAALGLLVLTLLNVVSIPHQRTSPLAFLIGVSAVVFAIQQRRPVRRLTAIGTFSYSIYLFHFFVIDFLDVNLAGAISRHTVAGFVIGVSAGVLIPIVIQLALVRFRIPRLLFLGLK